MALVSRLVENDFCSEEKRWLFHPAFSLVIMEAQPSKILCHVYENDSSSGSQSIFESITFRGVEFTYAN